MALGQKQNGDTVNGTVSINAITGQYVYTFNDPFNMLVYLTNTTDIITNGSIGDDKFNLMGSIASTVNGDKGNDIFNISATAGGLNDNVIKGGVGIDFITLSGSGTDVDLTQGSTQIEAIVGRQ